MEKCLYDYGIKFMKWRLKAQNSNNSPTKEEQLQRYDTLNKKEQFLYHNTNLVTEDGTAIASRGESGLQTRSDLPLTKSFYLGGKKKKDTDKQAKFDKNVGPPPIFLMMPTKEILHRMVIRSTHFKNISDLNDQLS